MPAARAQQVEWQWCRIQTGSRVHSSRSRINRQAGNARLPGEFAPPQFTRPRTEWNRVGRECGAETAGFRNRGCSAVSCAVRQDPENDDGWRSMTQPYCRPRNLWKPGRMLWTGAFWGGLAILCLALLLPPQFLPGLPSFRAFGASDKFQHAAAFFALMTVGYFAHRMPGREFLTAASLGVLGIVLEVAQAAIPGRTSSILDAAANVAGVACAVLVVRLVGVMRMKSAPVAPKDKRPSEVPPV